MPGIRPSAARRFLPTRRILWLLLLCAGLALLLSVDALHEALHHLLEAARPWIAAHPLPGAAAFILLSALSAVLAFFSTAVLVPVAVYNWGMAAAVALLWAGWLLGGACTFAIGRHLGRPLLRGLASERLIGFYRRRLDAEIGFATVVLLQLALPSEAPGYLCGLLRVRFSTYLAALALAELPFAVGTVLLGESVLRQRSGWLLVLAAAGGALMLVAWLALSRRLRAGPPGTGAARPTGNQGSRGG